MRIRKDLCVIFLLCFLLLLLAPEAQAAERWEEGWNPAITYEFDAETGTVTLSGTGELTVNPSYKPWGNYPRSVKKVVIGEGITGVGAKAFSVLQELTEVVLPKSVTSIGNGAFQNCNSLTSIDISNVTTLGQYAFSGCKALTAVNISSLTSLGKYAFQYCALRSIIIPEAITVIPRGAFMYCHELGELVLHDGVTQIGYQAFDSCFQLTSLRLPKELKELDDYAFADCNRLADIQLNEGLENIGRGALSSCESLKKLVIPDSVREIRDDAFRSCTNLQSIHFGKNLFSVNYSAFKECTNLTTFTINKDNPDWEVHNNGLYNKKTRELEAVAPGYEGTYVLPEGTLTIGCRAFYEGKVTAVTIPDTVKFIDDYAFADCYRLKTVSMGEGVEEIGFRTFTRAGITEITIPASVKKMGTDMFSGCTSLTKIIFQGLPPKVDTSIPEKGDIAVYYPGYMPEWENANVNGLGYYFDYIPYCNDRHDLRWEVIKAPTCQETGWRSETWCAVCREIVDPEGALPVLDHSYGAWTTVTSPTTEKEGLSKRTCTNCDASEQKVIPKLNSPTEPPTSEPTIPPETEPSQPPASEPPVLNPSEPTSTHPPVEPTSPSEPVPTEPDTQKKISSKPWLPVVTIAVVSILVGMVTSLLIFTFKKAKK